MKADPPCKTVKPWLCNNLGKGCLAPLTGTDGRALAAAVQIAELYSYHRSSSVLRAFGLVVLQMQEHTRELAYHSIAHVMDWSDRASIWTASGLPEFTPRKCAFEPGGTYQDGKDGRDEI